jgi:GntR family transcriptional regulator
MRADRTAAVLLMDISINLADGLPIYRQIVNQIRYMVASGILQPGDEIPSIRSTALKLKVTPNTVVKAHHELEAAGILVKRHGAGTFVAETRVPLARRERERIIEQRIDALLAEAHQLGYAEDELLAAFRRRQAALEGETNPEETDERMVG